MKHYRPNENEIRRFDALLKTVTPTDIVHQQYVLEAKSFLELSAANTINAGALKSAQRNRFKFYSSELFCGRKFLVGFFPDRWMDEHHPACNAVATDGFEFNGIKGPPIVVLRDGGHVYEHDDFRSILEHEMVHVNQALLGRFPGRTFPENPRHAFATMMTVLMAEYQANVLQLTKWPKLFPYKEVPFSLDQWCIFRGYTQALEAFLEAALSGQTSVICFKTVFDEAHETLREAFLNESLDEKMAKWLVLQITQHVGHALTVAIENSLVGLSRPAKALSKWIEKRQRKAS
jgi:hypothetical protein